MFAIGVLLYKRLKNVSNYRLILRLGVSAGIWRGRMTLQALHSTLAH